MPFISQEDAEELSSFVERNMPDRESDWADGDEKIGPIIERLMSDDPTTEE